MKFPIYLDYAATTPVDKRVADKMLQYLTYDSHFGNPASTHAFGQAAKAAVDSARVAVAALFNAQPEEIVWTSGATEANNLALKGAAQLYQRKGKHIITLKTEHKAVLDVCEQLEKNGYQVTYLTPEPSGLLDLDKLQAALRPDTILVSVMHVNNEIGIIQDISAIAKLTAERDILLHVDAAQSAGKISLNLQKTPVDLLSCSAHKIYGPKGMGALYVRRKPRVRVAAQLHGGGHEQGMRSGTLATHQIVGMGEAFRIAKEEMAADYKKIQSLRVRFLEQVSGLEKFFMNGAIAHCYPGIINVGILGANAKTLMQQMPELAISVGSACLAKGIEPSYVLRALGLSTEAASCALRFSFGRFTTEEEVDFAAQKLMANKS